MIRLILGALLVVVLIYGFIEAAPLIAGPRVALASPGDGIRAENGIVYIEGVAKRAESLALNGGPLLIEENGAFRKELVLPQGSVILSLTATDRFGRVDTVRRMVFVP